MESRWKGDLRFGDPCSPPVPNDMQRQGIGLGEKQDEGREMSRTSGRGETDCWWEKGKGRRGEEKRANRSLVPFYL